MLKTRPFYLLAILLLTAVLPVSIASHTRAAQTATAGARAAAARAAGTPDDAERAVLDLETQTLARDSGRLSVLAAGLFVCGVGAWSLSLARREGGLLGVPLLLTAVGVLVQMILV